jgi:hypothetical protein
MGHLRQWAPGGILFLVSAALQVSGITSTSVAIALMTVAAVWLLLTIPALSGVLPSVRVITGGPGFSQSFRPPEKRGKRKLRHDTLQVVREMRDLVSSDLPASSAHEDGLWAAMISAPDSEKRQAWQKYSSDSDVQRAHERAKLAALFGGRVRYIAGEYVRLGLLSESDLSLGMADREPRLDYRGGKHARKRGAQTVTSHRGDWSCRGALAWQFSL